VICFDCGIFETIEVIGMQFIIHSMSHLPQFAKRFLDEYGHRSCFAFYAEMGVGKTTIITAILKAMGVNSPEGSPTYSLVNVYASPLYGKIFHFDLYRLKNVTEAYDIGIEEMLYGGDLCFIEWPEKIAQFLPENTVSVYILMNEDNSRTLNVEV
jgi:tRNA threonylcarbamoyladenosine biosynthesis protein TsaE